VHCRGRGTGRLRVTVTRTSAAPGPGPALLLSGPRARSGPAGRRARRAGEPALTKGGEVPVTVPTGTAAGAQSGAGTPAVMPAVQADTATARAAFRRLRVLAECGMRTLRLIVIEE
jgi:hypothetical protein